MEPGPERLRSRFLHGKELGQALDLSAAFDFARTKEPPRQALRMPQKSRPKAVDAHDVNPCSHDHFWLLLLAPARPSSPELEPEFRYARRPPHGPCRGEQKNLQSQ
jgi:hypothetical protein